AWVGGEMAAASAQRVLVFPDQHVALRYDLVSLFAPGGQDYRLRHADGAALFNIRPMLADDRRIQIDMDDRTLTQFIPIWQRRVYGASMVTADYPDVDLQLARTGDELVATVHNRSKLVLLDNTVYYGDKCWRIAPEGIQPDGTVSVRLDAATGAPPAAGHPWTHLDNDVNDSWAHGRQFDMRDALRRGAVLFSSGNAGRAACPLLVAGAPQDETGPRVIQVLAYDEGSGS
ncbi:MAG: hypothetical protein JXR94_14235, partial [Candidatus Hydrogenedentes bacterium]|nr:hypothetical protein [Candidatus Hydrogenedentota bacterium]